MISNFIWLRDFFHCFLPDPVLTFQIYMNQYITFPTVRQQHKLAGILDNTSNCQKHPQSNHHGKIIHIVCPLMHLLQLTNYTIIHCVLEPHTYIFISQCLQCGFAVNAFILIRCSVKYL